MSSTKSYDVDKAIDSQIEWNDMEMIKKTHGERNFQRCELYKNTMKFSQNLTTVVAKIHINPFTIQKDC